MCTKAYIIRYFVSSDSLTCSYYTQAAAEVDEYIAITGLYNVQQIRVIRLNSSLLVKLILLVRGSYSFPADSIISSLYIFIEWAITAIITEQLKAVCFHMYIYWGRREL